MKKILFSVLGAGLLLTSCSSDEPIVGGEGQEQQVTFTINVPEAMGTRAGKYVNSAKGGVTNGAGELNYTVALTRPDGTVVWSENVPDSQTSTTATFTPTVVLGYTYNIVAYAHFGDAVAAPAAATNVSKSALANIATLKGINDESEDAYFHNGTILGAPQMAATLKRPFGKLRLVAEDYDAVNALGLSVKDIKVTYTNDNISSTFNVIDKAFGTPSTELVYTGAETTYSEEPKNTAKSDYTVFVDYLPAAAEGENHYKFNIEVTYTNGETYSRTFSQDIPVKRNHLTTLRGNFFTTQAQLTLTVEEMFEEENITNFNEQLQWVLDNGGEYTLQENLNVTESLIVGENANVILNLNGYDIINNSGSVELEKGDGIIVYGSLTINGEGKVQGGTRAVWARGNTGATIIINGGNFIGATADDANCEVIYASGDGVINIYGGTFKADKQSTGFAEDQYAVLNLQGNGKSGCDINVYGGKFLNFDPANNVSENPKAGYHDSNFVAEGYKSVKTGDYYTVIPNDEEPKVISTADELVEALENDENVLFTRNIKIDPASMSNAYGTTGINVKNGQTIDGSGFTLDIKDAGGTWDSGINTTGGLIKNLTVTGSFRGIFINHNSNHSEPVILENVVIDGTTYTISCDQGMNQTLVATNSTFKGWTSYAATLGEATFTNCYFGEGNGNSFCRPYAPTAFVGCEFEAGFEMDPRAAVTFENCTIGGVVLTADNLATLVTSNIANATVK